MNDISYWSMMPSLSYDQKEREKIGAFARICANVGIMSNVFFSANNSSGNTILTLVSILRDWDFFKEELRRLIELRAGEENSINEKHN